MRQLLSAIALWAAAPSIALAQVIALPEAARQIAAALQEVGDNKTTIAQTLETPTASQPCRVAYIRRTTDPKGKANEERWDFNLADIDPNTVRWEDKKTVILVAMRTLREQRFIRYARNGETLGYTDHVEFFGKGIDNARDLEKHIESAIPAAREAWEKEANIQAKTPAELIETLIKTVGEVPQGGQTLKQKIEPVGDFPDRLRLNVETFSPKGLVKKEVFTWSLGDLTEQTLRLSMQNDRPAIEAKARRSIRWISSEKDGGPPSFDNELQIAAADPDQGKMVQAILQKLIPFGEEQIRKRLPNPTSAPDALARLAATLGKVSYDKTDTEQTLKTECLTHLTRRESNERKNQVNEYTFHFGDLNDKSISLEIGSKAIEVVASTAEKAKFIAVLENGEPQNHTSKIAFRFPDVEQARLFEHLLPVAIEQCRQKPLPQDFEWLQRQATASEKTTPNIVQKLEKQAVGTSSCKWKLTRIETREKKSKEQIFEFNLYDLDPRQVNIAVSGRTVSIELQTKYRQKIISRYEDGKPEYGAEISLLLPDIESAKTARETLLALMEGCKQ